MRGDELVLCLALMNARTPDVPAIAAACGYDAVYVDLEHTSTSLETAAMLCASASARESRRWSACRLMIRASSLRVFDNGATGVIVPHVNSKTEAAAVVDAARFPPIGHRSISGPNAVSGYQPRSPGELTAVLEHRTVVAVMIETPQAVDAADAIGAVEGIDMILLVPAI